MIRKKILEWYFWTSLSPIYHVSRKSFQIFSRFWIFFWNVMIVMELYFGTFFWKTCLQIKCKRKWIMVYNNRRITTFLCKISKNDIQRLEIEFWWIINSVIYLHWTFMCIKWKLRKIKLARKYQLVHRQLDSNIPFKWGYFQA